jgi:hypothetical protein
MSDTTALDLLAIASRRRYLAWEGWYATLQMQRSSDAQVAVDAALARLTIAEQDLNRVQALIVELESQET